MTSSTLSTPFEFLLPDIGEGVVEGEIVRWLVSEGDSLVEDQPMVEVMTDKATVEIPSPKRGRVAKILWKEGQIVPVHKALLVIELEGGASAPAAVAAPAGPVHAPVAAAQVVVEAPTAGTTPVPGAAASSVPHGASAAPAAHGRPGRVLATPATRRRARELGVELSAVTGTGPSGRVTRQDVEAHGTRPTGAPARAHAAVAIAASSPADERVPLKGLRRKIAEKMVQSAYTAPHVTYVDEADLTELVALRQRLRAAAEAKGVKLSYLPFVVKAVVAALKRFPYLNASLDDAAGEIVLKKGYHIGIATATDAGLVVPVVHDADRKSLLEIATDIAQLSARAREGKSAVSDFTGGTFTISSVGNIGGLFATPIINHPEVAILGFNKIQPRPVVHDGQVAVRQMTYLALSFDHRVIDGAMGADFTNALIAYLQDPALLMLELGSGL